MKILVFSDAHGSTSGVEDALALHPDAEHVIFLGDGADELENLSYCYPDIEFHLLAGNCDPLSDFPTEAVLTISGVRIFACHGHTLSVKNGSGAALRRAKSEDARILLYGHTHEQDCHYDDGVTVLNPGSISRPLTGTRRQYALLSLQGTDVLPSLASL